MTILFSLLVGYAIGLVQKGIHVHVNTKAEETNKPVEKSKVVTKHLPPEYQKFIQENQGSFINF